MARWTTEDGYVPDHEADVAAARAWALFTAKIKKTDTCWLWTGAKDMAGYGRVKRRPKTFRAHRFAYEHLVGPVPAGLTLDHLCRVRHCVNPDHLEPVTVAENIRRGNVVRDYSKRNYRNGNTLKTVCIHGHPLIGMNVHFDPKSGKRRCNACAMMRMRQYRATKRGEDQWLTGKIRMS